MSHGPIDPLRQLPLAPRDVAGTPNRARGEGVPFDRHLQTAGTADAAATTRSSHEASDDAPFRKSSASDSSKTASAPPQKQPDAAPVAAASTGSRPSEKPQDDDTQTHDPAGDAAADGEENVAVVTPTTAVPASQGPKPGVLSSADEIVGAGDELAPPTDARSEVAELPADADLPPSNVNAPDARRKSNAARREKVAVDSPAGEAKSTDRASVETTDSPLAESRSQTQAADDVRIERVVDAADARGEPSESKPQNPLRSEKPRSGGPLAGENSKSVIPSQNEVTRPTADQLATPARASANADRTAAKVNPGEDDASTDLRQAESDGPTSVRREEAAVAGAGPRPRATPVASAAVSPSPVATAVTPTAIVGETPTDGADGSKSEPRTSDTKPSVLTTFARLERNGSLAARDIHAAPAHDGPQVDPARFVSRVVRAIHAAHDRGGPLLLRLSPPELGALRLEISLQQGVLSATIEADNAHARQLLLDNLPSLRDRLAEQNVRIDRFDVDVRRDGDGRETSSFNPQQHRQPQDDAPRGRPAGNQRAAATEQVPTSPAPTRRITDTSINVIA